MIKYFKELFTKPKYQWTTLDEWAMIGLILVLVLICVLIIGALYWIYLTICETKYKKCKNKKFDGFDSHKCRNKNCLFCNKYRKKEKSNERKI